MINAQFDKVKSLADGVLFEFGSSRRQDLRLRDHIRQWQPQLRVLFMMRIASLEISPPIARFRIARSSTSFPAGVR
jgi:multidrug resistance protein MdtO